MNSPILTYILDTSFINKDVFDKLIIGIKDYRKEKIEKLSMFDTKCLSLGVEILIKKACEDFQIDYNSLEIKFNENGKPYFKNSKYFFNTAHSGKYAICVISDKEVGIDIEEIKDYKAKVAERCFTPLENKYIEVTNDKVDLFYRLWTLKESYVKCIGSGLCISLNSFSLVAKDNNIVIEGKDNYQFYEKKFENYRIAWCVNVNFNEKEKYVSTIKVLSL